MNVHDVLKDPGFDLQSLRDTLISHCKLSVADVGRVEESMRATGGNFIDCAMSLKLVTEQDVEDSIAWAERQRNRNEPSLIESALNRAVRRVPPITLGAPLTAGERLVIAHNPGHERSETLRALRTELLLLNDGSTALGRAFAILSPGSNEGRTQLAAELAIALSQLGQKTLLIDSDLRNPEMHQLFGSDNTSGLSSILASGDSPVVHPVRDFPELFVMTSGPQPKNPLELLSDGRFARLMAKLRSSYEFIILDTPPGSQVADALTVAMIATRVLLVSRARETSYKATKDLLRRVATTRAQVMGSVINHF